MQLSSIFPRDNAKGHDSSPTYIPLARVDRKGIQDWSQFPLDNVQNIRDWQYTCIGQGTGSSGTGSIKPSPSSGSAHQERGLKRKFSETSGAQSPASSQNESSVVPGAVISPRHHHDQPGYSPVASRLPLDHYWLSLESVTSKQQLDSGIPFSKDVSFIGDGPIYPEELQPVQTSSNWEGAPSANFQQRFLW
ncbi:kinesin light chain [Penicillium argentinense]|uniref:Kinesin light chain n=1 Tax=Penicillium argentinense TaxID=1131581 RepID=A0A9W9EQ33_9EURO|nr:kinesin light chain [Penicillium argentinense]KAJ5085932.1 kinesin light chain [Penicillium argentinense]